MTENKLSPQQKPARTEQVSSTSNTELKVFNIKKCDFESFDELFKTSSSAEGVEFEIFFCNARETQWGYLRIVDGKPRKMKPLLEINILSVKLVNPRGLDADGYIVEYCMNTQNNVTEVYIPSEAVQKNKLLLFFSLPPNASKQNDELCNRLLKHIILYKTNKVAPNDNIQIGTTQGWNIKNINQVIFEAKNNYPNVLHHLLPQSIMHCEKPVEKFNAQKYENYTQNFQGFFMKTLALKVLYLLRITSFHSTFAYQCGEHFDLLPNIVPSKTISQELIVSILQNNGIQSGSLLTLGDNSRKFQEHIAESNDAMIVFLDSTSLDEEKKRRSSIASVENAILSRKKGNRFVAAIISDYAAQQISPELRCPLLLSDCILRFEPCLLRKYLHTMDSHFISEIETNFRSYNERYHRNHEDVSNNVPEEIPPCRHSAYICMITAARTYDEFFELLFGEETEQFVIEWLSNTAEQGKPMDEELIQRFGRILNQEIANGRFRFIKRKKFLTFDQSTDSVIIDDDYIYLETAVVEKLAVAQLGLHSVNSLTDALKANECLTINDHHSKCYRFHLQNTNGDLYWLYTYGINQKLLTAENRRRINFAEQEKFFLNKFEFESAEILPLGIIDENSYIGKDISCGNRSNDHIFVTGKSGSGKSFCVITMLPSFAMLGNRMLVFDVSGSFTREEILGANAANEDRRPLSENVVNTLFDFINIDEGKVKIPVNPLFIGDCTSLPEKKRHVVGFITAAGGKLSKDEIRYVTSLISSMLKKHSALTTVPLPLLRETLNSGGKIGQRVCNLISTVLDDIETIGCQEQGWSEFFENSKQIPVISLGAEQQENVHPLLDVLLASAFEWQREHQSKPLVIALDEIKRQSFFDGSPLHTIITQGRKFSIKLIGMTQEYVSRDSHEVDIMKEAGIQIFFQPANAKDKVAAELGYRDAQQAGLGSLGIGEFIVKADLYNKLDEVNEPAVIACKTLKFQDSPLFDKYMKTNGEQVWVPFEKNESASGTQKSG